MKLKRGKKSGLYYFGDAIGIVLILAIIAAVFFMNTFRWGSCP